MIDHRKQFHVPGPGPYLLSHSVGCLPRAARAELWRNLFTPWSREGSDAWPDWLAAVERFRAAISGLLGGEPHEVCPQPGVSAALTTLLSGLERKPKQDVLLASAHSFPSIGFAMKQFERLGYKLSLLPETSDPSDPATWTEAIGPHVAAVVAMHVHSNSGKIAPVDAIVEAARKAGAISVIDVCQSAGIVPIDVRRWNADAVIGSCVKWLCGGSGAGYLWVGAERLGHYAPINVGWFSHENPFAFDIRDFRYAPDARRFWGGTPSVAPYILASVGINTIAGIGPGKILDHNRRLIAHVAAEARIELDMEDRGGTLCLTAPDVDAVAASLTAAGCRFDRRANVVRLSLHIYNFTQEARRIGRALRGLDVSLV